jgi:transposase
MSPRYTDEFKEAAVRQVLENDYTIKETAHRLGVHPYSLSKWVKQFNDPMTHKVQDEKHQEILRLKKELKRVTEERDILKKAAAYFAKHQS